MSEYESKVKFLADETSGNVVESVGDGGGEVLSIKK